MGKIILEFEGNTVGDYLDALMDAFIKHYEKEHMHKIKRIVVDNGIDDCIWYENMKARTDNDD